MALNANALTTLNQFKLQIDLSAAITNLDTRLEMYINAASQVIESYCNRSFKQMTHTEFQHGARSNIILLAQWPITSVTEVNIDQDKLFGASTIIPATQYSISDRNTSLSVSMKTPGGQNNVKIVYVAGYANIPSDLELACIWAAEWFYHGQKRQDMGRTSVSKGDESVGVLSAMPEMILELLQNYKRTEFFDASRSDV